MSAAQTIRKRAKVTDRSLIEDQAAAFLQKRDVGPWTQADEAELSAWLEGSTARRVAYLRAEAAWESMGRLKALGAGLPHRQVPGPEVVDAAASPRLSESDGQKPPELLRRPLGQALGGTLGHPGHTDPP